MMTNSELSDWNHAAGKGKPPALLRVSSIGEQGDGDAGLLEDGPEHHRGDEEHEDRRQTLAVEVAAHGEPDDRGDGHER